MTSGALATLRLIVCYIPIDKDGLNHDGPRGGGVFVTDIGSLPLITDADYTITTLYPIMQISLSMLFVISAVVVGSMCTEDKTSNHLRKRRLRRRDAESDSSRYDTRELRECCKKMVAPILKPIPPEFDFRHVCDYDFDKSKSQAQVSWARSTQIGEASSISVGSVASASKTRMQGKAPACRTSPYMFSLISLHQYMEGFVDDNRRARQEMEASSMVDPT